MKKDDRCKHWRQCHQAATYNQSEIIYSRCDKKKIHVLCGGMKEKCKYQMRLK